jgi:hypothetical protein
MGRLQAHMVMTGPTRIQTRDHGFKRVAAAGIRKLMSPTPESLQIVLTVAVGVPEIEQGAGDWLASTVENESGHSARNTRYTRFAEIRFERRIGPEKRPRRFLGRELKLVTDGWSGLKLDRLAAAAEQSLDPREKGNRGRRNGHRTKKPAP